MRSGAQTINDSTEHQGPQRDEEEDDLVRVVVVRKPVLEAVGQVRHKSHTLPRLEVQHLPVVEDHPQHQVRAPAEDEQEDDREAAKKHQIEPALLLPVRLISLNDGLVESTAFLSQHAGQERRRSAMMQKGRAYHAQLPRGYVKLRDL